MADADRTMRVLLAIDGSQGSDVAIELVRGIAWPPAARLRIVTVVVDGEYDEEGQPILDAALRALGDAPHETTSALLYGRPATRIVDDAREFAADVIVTGSRGQGALSAMLLGSVAAEVVDHARRPVLVARRPSLHRVLLAHDGSACAGAAEKLVADWPIFARTPIDVLSVAELPVPWHLPSTSTLYGTTVHGYFADSRAILEAHAALADEVAARLKEMGREAVPLMSEGSIARQVIDMAELRSADLVVMGTHGRTGLARALLGSVARNVLLYAPTSVLIACPAEAADRPTPEPART